MSRTLPSTGEYYRPQRAARLRHRVAGLVPWARRLNRDVHPFGVLLVTGLLVLLLALLWAYSPLGLLLLALLSAATATATVVAACWLNHRIDLDGSEAADLEAAHQALHGSRATDPPAATFAPPAGKPQTSKPPVNTDVTKA